MVQELIDKYINKYIRIEGNDVTVKFKDFERFEQRVSEIFDEPFYLVEWLRNNIGDEFTLTLTGYVKVWFAGGQTHRDGAPAKVFDDGDEEWFRYGIRHRDGDLPAIVNDGSYAWYKDGRKHRVNGPAVIYPNGSKEWYLDGRSMYEEDFNEAVNKKNHLE